MKNLLKLLIVVIALTVTTQSFAQVKFGVKAGLNIANMLEKDNDETYSKDYKSKIGFHLGGTADFAISEKFAIEPGLLFSTKGYKMEDSGETMSYNLNYLEIPINAVYKIDLGSAKVLINAGPYLGFAISGKMKASVARFGENGDEKEQKIEIGSDKEKDMIKPLDFGLNFGAGVDIKGITIGLQYGLGLANLSLTTDNGYKMNNKVFGISVGYKLGGK
jgi:hypothetical protein